MSELFDVLDENGNFTGIKATREECHKKGLKHRAVALFIINSKGQVLLQKRSLKHKMWPGMWDLSACGHVDSGETSFQAIHRELLEELGIDINSCELQSIGIVDSENKQGELINRHRNHYFVYITDDIELESLVLQEDEVSEVKWIDREEIIKRIKDNYKGITDKSTAWNCLIEFFKERDKQHSNKKENGRE